LSRSRLAPPRHSPTHGKNSMPIRKGPAGGLRLHRCLRLPTADIEVGQKFSSLNAAPLFLFAPPVFPVVAFFGPAFLSGFSDGFASPAARAHRCLRCQIALAFFASG